VNIYYKGDVVMNVSDILDNIQIPSMLRVRQKFSNDGLSHIERVVEKELHQLPLKKLIHPEMKIAIAVGSRGMADILPIVQTVVTVLKRYGADPFIIPAMGSHGGATASGQQEILSGLGITDNTVYCPIKSSMETVELGKLSNGLHVYLDKNAAQADGIVVINRVKAHTGFSGKHESGLAKMLVIGLGKQKGAAACHGQGRSSMSQNIEQAARLVLKNAPILFGVATVENAYDQVKQLKAVTAKELLLQDEQLLIVAKNSMAKILVQPIDVLVVDQIGKEFSGAGMDPHVTGRASWPTVKVGPDPKRIVVLDLSDRSHGNAVGMGVADVATQRFFHKINFADSYINALTAGGTQGVKLPVIVESDRLALQAAIRTCGVSDPKKIRLVRIANTLNLSKIYISESMREIALHQSNLDILQEHVIFQFNQQGNFINND